MAYLKDTLDKKHQHRLRWAYSQLDALIKELDAEGWAIDRNDEETLSVLRQYSAILYSVGRPFQDLVEEMDPTPDTDTDE